MTSRTNKIKNYLRNCPLPFGLSYPYGTLYGWNWHQFRYNPEPENVAFFAKHLKKSDRVADVGANIGYFTLQFAQLAGEVLAFEPSEVARAHLTKATRGLLNVHIRSCAIYSENATMALYSPSQGHGEASLIQQNNFNPTSALGMNSSNFSTFVVVRPLKDFGYFDWVKIDVEGAELEVIRGMHPTNAVVEVAGGLLGGVDGIRAFLASIADMGYGINLITSTGDTVPYTGHIEIPLNTVHIYPNQN